MSSLKQSTSRTAPRTREKVAKVAVAHDRNRTRLTLTLPRLSELELAGAVKSLAVFAEMLEVQRGARPAIR